MKADRLNRKKLTAVFIAPIFIAMFIGSGLYSTIMRIPDMWTAERWNHAEYLVAKSHGKSVEQYRSEEYDRWRVRHDQCMKDAREKRLALEHYTDDEREKYAKMECSFFPAVAAFPEDNFRSYAAGLIALVPVLNAIVIFLVASTLLSGLIVYVLPWLVMTLPKRLWNWLHK
ncbi:hypothetical protein ACTOV4_00475 [Brucella sp. C7-11G]